MHVPTEGIAFRPEFAPVLQAGPGSIAEFQSAIHLTAIGSQTKKPSLPSIKWPRSISLSSSLSWDGPLRQGLILSWDILTPTTPLGSSALPSTMLSREL